MENTIDKKVVYSEKLPTVDEYIANRDWTDSIEINNILIQKDYAERVRLYKQALAKQILKEVVDELKKELKEQILIELFTKK